VSSFTSQGSLFSVAVFNTSLNIFSRKCILKIPHLQSDTMKVTIHCVSSALSSEVFTVPALSYLPLEHPKAKSSSLFARHGDWIFVFMNRPRITFVFKLLYPPCRCKSDIMTIVFSLIYECLTTNIEYLWNFSHFQIILLLSCLTICRNIFKLLCCSAHCCLFFCGNPFGLEVTNFTLVNDHSFFT
jgi:hypothetical protein